MSSLNGIGSIGKTVVPLAEMFASPRTLNTVAFDSDSSYPIDVAGNTISVAFDGEDVLQAKKNGDFSYFSYIDPDMESSHQISQAFHLYPPMGYEGSTTHRRTIESALVNMVSMASGDINVIFIYSSFGGTSRGCRHLEGGHFLTYPGVQAEK